MSDEAIELLVIGNSTPEIEAYLSHIRNSGYAAHANQISHDADLLGEKLKQHRDLDILLYTLDSKEEKLNPDQLFAVLHAINPSLPVIALTDQVEETEQYSLMKAGAADLIEIQAYSHLTLAILREYKHLQTTRQLQQVERQYLEAQERCNALTENSRDAIAYVHEGMYVTANRAYLELFGLAGEDEIEGLPMLDMIAPSEHTIFKKLLRKISANVGHNEELTAKCLRSDDKEFSAELHFSPANIDGEPCTQVVIHDQSISKEVEEKLRLLSTQDVQTGLFNRQYFINILDQETRDHCNRGRNQQTLFYITLDNFSEIRNSAGIKTSDTLLMKVARILKRNIDRDDLLARFGDHTFTCLTPGNSVSKAKKKAKAICDAIAKHSYDEVDESLAPSCSIGIALTSKEINSGHEFITSAYHACEAARSEGPNGFAISENKPTDEKGESASEANLSHLIQYALDNDQFQLVYQPIVSLHGDTRENYAVTVRLMDEQQEEIQPEHFMTQAETIGKTHEVDRWVIRHAIKELSKQRKQGHKVNFFINISGASLEDDTMLLYICDCLRDYEAKGPWVTFQCTDSAARTHMQKLEKLSEGLKRIKCKLCIDHFGLAKKPEAILSGTLPLDYIQFAPSFLDGLSEDQKKQDSLNQLNELIQEKNIKTIASGVEEASNLAILWSIGVNYIRGYFIQEPMQSIDYDFVAD
jgi:diguanylate cyclase (GGDEF)-like protein/PAS domain S-box-containing protein